MSVTTEDGGRLNAFAKEPRMEVMAVAAGRSAFRAGRLPKRDQAAASAPTPGLVQEPSAGK